MGGECEFAAGVNSNADVRQNQRGIGGSSISDKGEFGFELTCREPVLVTFAPDFIRAILQALIRLRWNVLTMARIALLFVVFIDILGLGLLLPILSSLMLDSSQHFLPKEISQAGRELRYGTVLGLFYLAWFFGAAFISKLSDYIGRKVSILICLFGALVGYALTIVAIEYSSMILLIVGRFIGGFTAGNQPIAQAALIDQARDDRQKAEFMGQMVAAVSLGLITGPLLTASLSSRFVMGNYASLSLPVFAAIGLVLVNIVLIILYFRETLISRRKIDFGLSEVFLTLLRIRHHRVTLRLAPVFFFAVMGFNGFFIFLNDFLITRFSFDTVQNSIVMVVHGATMGSISLYLVGPVLARYRHVDIMIMTVAIMAVFITAYVFNPVAALSYVLVIPIIAAFGIAYPTLLSMFSASIDESRQGWVMGVCVALFTLGSGSVSIAGGSLMELNPGLPLFIGIGSCLVALVLIAVLWRGNPDVERLGPGEAGEQ